ncbi:MAG: hypothetical protein M3159_06285 [Actinomycetota bacterium]|nr:hypothetical protein [Actinomycetota bacterium]
MEKRHFWSSAPGIITGVAGFLSATAAVVGLLVTFGVIGGKDSSSNKDTGTVTDQTSTASGGPTATTVAAAPTFSVTPTSLVLKSLAPSGKVVVKNTGETDLSVQTDLQGDGAAQFAVKDAPCTNDKIPAGASCEMTVTFTPNGIGQYSAKIVIKVKGASKVSEISLQGSPL